MLGIKQDHLAHDLGDDWNQKKISLLEAKEEIEPALLEQVAKALKIPIAAIERFDEEAAINIISNTFSDFKDNAIASAMNYHCTFNPIDKVVELLERMIVEKDAQIAKLKDGKKK